MVSRPSVRLEEQSQSSRSSRLPLIVNLDGFSPVRLEEQSQLSSSLNRQLRVDYESNHTTHLTPCGGT